MLQRSRRQSDPQSAPEAPAPSGSAGVTVLAAMQEQQLELIRELIDVLRANMSSEPESPAVTLTVSAGPFATNEEVREFARELAGAPRVREVALRGYEGEDRALLDVQLTQRSA